MPGFQYWLKRALRRWSEPSLNDFYYVSRFQTVNPKELLLEMGVPGDKIQEYALELREAIETNPNRNLPMPYPVIWNIEHDEETFLYSIVRHARPDWVVETGVANGVSSFVVLSAMKANETGRLVSYDPGYPGKPLGAIVPSSLSDRWTLLTRTMNGSPLAGLTNDGVNIFLHDSEHNFTNQLSEYRSAWQSLKPGGLLLSDDIDASFAFVKFSKEIQRKPDVLIGYRKVMGVLRKPA